MYGYAWRPIAVGQRLEMVTTKPTEIASNDTPRFGGRRGNRATPATVDRAMSAPSPPSAQVRHHRPCDACVMPG